jgi:hypothetical protein
MTPSTSFADSSRKEPMPQRHEPVLFHQSWQGALTLVLAVATVFVCLTGMYTHSCPPAAKQAKVFSPSECFESVYTECKAAYQGDSSAFRVRDCTHAASDHCSTKQRFSTNQ